MHFYVDPHQRPFFRYKCILFITAPRMVKTLGISECCKVNICIFMLTLIKDLFLDTNVFYSLLDSEWSKLWAFLSVVRQIYAFCMLTLIKDLFFRYKSILFITALRMFKALGISECCKVNICILYVDPHQRPFF